MGDLDLFSTGPQTGNSPAATPADDGLKFPELDHFVDYLARLYRRDVGSPKQFRWCSKWWNHSEAQSRLEALWRAFEHQRRDPATGMSNWWKEADRTMSQLLSPTGPFTMCRDGHKLMPPLPCDPAPPGLFNKQLYGY